MGSFQPCFLSRVRVLVTVSGSNAGQAQVRGISEKKKPPLVHVIAFYDDIFDTPGPLTRVSTSLYKKTTLRSVSQKNIEAKRKAAKPSDG